MFREPPPIATVQTTATYRKTTDIGVFWPDAGGDEDVVDKDSLANF